MSKEVTKVTENSLDKVDISLFDKETIDPGNIVKVIDCLLSGLASARDIAEKLHISYKEVAIILSNKELVTKYHQMTKSLARAEFDTVAYNKLIDIIKNSDTEQNVIAATTALAKILGVTAPKKGKGVNINFNIDKYIKDLA